MSKKLFTNNCIQVHNYFCSVASRIWNKTVTSYLKGNTIDPLPIIHHWLVKIDEPKYNKHGLKNTLKHETDCRCLALTSMFIFTYIPWYWALLPINIAYLFVVLLFTYGGAYVWFHWMWSSAFRQTSGQYKEPAVSVDAAWFWHCRNISKFNLDCLYRMMTSNRRDFSLS